jgi:ATP-dependent Clp protease protease subunit
VLTWLPPDLDETVVVEAAARRGLGVYGLAPYRVAAGAAGLVFGYGALTESTVVAGIDLLDGNDHRTPLRAIAPGDGPTREASQPDKPLQRWRFRGQGGPVINEDMYDRLLEERIVVVDKEIDDDVANRVTAQLLLLERADPTSDIRLYVNSPGGSVTAAMAVVDTIRLIDCDVETCAMGLAGGTAQLVVSAGAKDKRYALSHSKFLLVRPTNDPDREPEAQLRLRDQVAELEAELTGQPVDRIRADWDPQRWFDADEARAYGMVDRVVDNLRRE